MRINVTVLKDSEYPSVLSLDAWGDEILGKLPGGSTVNLAQNQAQNAFSYTVVAAGISNDQLETIAESIIKPAKSGHFTLTVS